MKTFILKLLDTAKKNYLLSRDNLDNIPRTFNEELKLQSKRIIIPGTIIASVAWLNYIPIDKELYPNVEALLYIRLGLTIISIISLLLYFTSYFRNISQIILFTLAFYLGIATALLTGLVKADPSYMGGYFFILMLSIVAPFPRNWIWFLLASSIITFISTITILEVDFSNTRIAYSLNDLAAISENLLICSMCW